MIARGVTFFDTAEVYGPYTNDAQVALAWLLARQPPPAGKPVFVLHYRPTIFWAASG